MLKILFAGDHQRVSYFVISYTVLLDCLFVFLLVFLCLIQNQRVSYFVISYTILLDCLFVLLLVFLCPNEVKVVSR